MALTVQGGGGVGVAFGAGPFFLWWGPVGREGAKVLGGGVLRLRHVSAPPPRIGVIFRVGGAARGAPAPGHRSNFSSLPMVITGLHAQVSSEDSEEDARPRTAPHAGCKIWGAGEYS